MYWTERQTGEQTIFTLINGSNISELISSAISKAVGLISKNINDSSFYLLCEWKKETEKLSITLTDDQKQSDSPNVVEVKLPVNRLSEYESLELLIKDYLTTCNDFFQYSLVAIYTDGERSLTRLL